MQEHSHPSCLESVLGLPSVCFGDRKKLPDSPGVYFVVDEDQILYVGITSSSLRTRWASHHRYDQVAEVAPQGKIFFQEVPESFEQLREREDRLIAEFRPTLNYQPVPQKNGKGPSRYNVMLDSSEVNSYWKILGCSPDAWMELPDSQKVSFAWKDMQHKLRGTKENAEESPE